MPRSHAGPRVRRVMQPASSVTGIQVSVQPSQGLDLLANVCDILTSIEATPAHPVCGCFSAQCRAKDPRFWVLTTAKDEDFVRTQIKCSACGLEGYKIRKCSNMKNLCNVAGCDFVLCYKCSKVVRAQGAFGIDYRVCLGCRHASLCVCRRHKNLVRVYHGQIAAPHALCIHCKDAHDSMKRCQQCNCQFSASSLRFPLICMSSVVDSQSRSMFGRTHPHLVTLCETCFMSDQTCYKFKNAPDKLLRTCCKDDIVCQCSLRTRGITYPECNKFDSMHHMTFLQQDPQSTVPMPLFACSGCFPQFAKAQSAYVCDVVKDMRDVMQRLQ